MYDNAENEVTYNGVKRISWECEGTITIVYVPDTLSAGRGEVSYKVDMVKIRELCVAPMAYIEIKRGQDQFFIEFPRSATVRINRDKREAEVIPMP